MSKACSQGLLEHCDCHTDEDLIEELEEQFPDVVFSNGCSDNIEYGIEVAKIFLNERYLSGGHSLRHELIQHNFDAAEAVSTQWGWFPIVNATYMYSLSELPLL